LTHGTPTSPVVVEATTDDGILRLSVENRGPPINPAIVDKLFQPFFRSTAYANKEGLGLGLYIAHEIARGHSGKLEVTSTQDSTRFTLVMPTREQPLREH
jgi:signal transduction histidine kinase